MAQTTFHRQPSGLHLAMIMDGNGRWATERGLPRAVGHREGARTAQRIVEAAPAAGIGTLSLYAFSADNWRRPAREVSWLMRLFREYLRTEAARCHREGVRLGVIGRRDRLPAGVLQAIEAAEALTRGGRRLHLRIAIDYSAREAILRAAARLPAGDVPSPERFAEALGAVEHGGAATPAVDLLVRTGGEQRLSDFLLWESAYAELLFSPKMWPDFTPDDLRQAVAAFHGRERRFGALPDAASA